MNVLRVCLLLCLLYFTGSECARRVDVAKRYADGLSEFRRRRSGGDVIRTESSLSHMLHLQGGEHLKETVSIETSTGTHKEKLIELWNGLPVKGQAVVIETGAHGELTGEITGHLIEGINGDIGSAVPEISETKALAIALEERGHSSHEIRPDTTHVQLIVYVDDQGELTGEVNAVLAYQVSYVVLNADGSATRPSFYLDANDGAVIKEWEGITNHKERLKRAKSRLQDRDSGYSYDYDYSTPSGPGGSDQYSDSMEHYLFETDGGNIKMGRHRFGEDLPALKIATDGKGTCFMENEKCRVVDSRSGSRGVAFSFPCADGFTDEINGAYSPMADAYFYGNVVHDMFHQWLGMIPLSFKIELVVHEGNNLENAFWDGSVTSFGDGYSFFHPLTVLDIVAHEVSHGFTEQQSGLIYNGHSGGMNEAFSDITGTAAEAYIKEAGWLNGEFAVKEAEGALRYFEMPSMDGKSVDTLQGYCPGMDVHYSSGIFNRAFYILAKSPGWTVRTAFEVFAVANQLYWTEDSSFNAGSCGIIKAVQDKGHNVTQVTAILNEVGLTPCGPDRVGVESISDLHALANETLTFHFNLDSTDTETLRVESYTDYGSSHFSISVESPTGRVVEAGPHHRCAENRHESCPAGLVYVHNPPQGEYIVRVHAITDISDVDLYVISDQIVLYDMESDRGTESVTANFTLPDQVVQSGDAVAIRTVHVGVDIGGNVPDFYLNQYIIKPGQNQSASSSRNLKQWSSGSRDNSKNRVMEVLICNPTAGEYSLQSDIWDWDNQDGLRLVMEKMMFPI